jgi:hypothetical protein
VEVRGLRVRVAGRESESTTKTRGEEADEVEGRFGSVFESTAEV